MIKFFKHLFRFLWALCKVLRRSPELYRYIKSDIRETREDKADRLDRLRNPHKYRPEQ